MYKRQAVASAPDTASAVAPEAPLAATDVLGDKPDPAIRPNPAMGEITPDAGRTEVAPGTPAPVAPLAVDSAPVPSAPVPSAPVLAAPVLAAPVPSAPVAAAPASSEPGSSAPVAAASVSSGPVAPEPEPLDLLAVAGNSIYKRLIPVAVGAAAVAVAIWLIARR